ncbi:hypothetical protein BDF19DRAFT_475365 [Syncephalis fuscata]|nr:hypothetical protein BDF19DRAFT_475365 [Syncephalis fuscata]
MQLLPTLVATALLVTAIPASLGEEIKIIPGPSTFRNAYVGVKDKSGIEVPFIYSNSKSTKAETKWTRTSVFKIAGYYQLKYNLTNKCLSYDKNSNSLSMVECNVKSVQQAWNFYEPTDERYKGFIKLIPLDFDEKYKKNGVCLEQDSENYGVKECDHKNQAQYVRVEKLS